MKLALFDLDGTLIPFDSGSRWIRFLISRGVLQSSFADEYLEYCRDYVMGKVDIMAMQIFMLGHLAAHPRGLLERWREDFAGEVASSVPPASHELVKRYREQ